LTGFIATTEATAASPKLELPPQRLTGVLPNPKAEAR
jgi:hypothetical protein